jgi:prophage endopeptidase
VNPWLILAAVGFAAVTAWVGYSQGREVEKAAWLKKENTELVAANKKIDELHTKAREKEKEHAMAVALISKTLEGENNVVRKQTENRRAAARTGGLRLRDPGIRKDTGGGIRPPASPAPCKRDGEAGADISTAASDFLLQLTGEADEVVVQLTACQAVVEQDRKTQ